MRTTLLFLVTLSVAAHAAEPSYEYEPKKSTLTGTIRNDKVFYGPPGYGANPAEDAQERPDRLVLEQPISVKEDPKTPDNVAETGVKELQLVVGLDPKRLDGFRDRRVEVTGVLFHAHTGHHFTKVLLTVETVRHGENPKR